MSDITYKVKDQTRFVKHITEYQNGILTTGGLYTEDQLEQATDAISITYNSEACTELPVGWPRMRFLDDNNKRQFIKEVRFDHKGSPAYVMADGSLSWEVTE